MRAVQNESGRRSVRSSVLLVAGGLIISGTALAVGGMGSSTFLRRGSMLASLFVAITVLLITIAVGRAVSPIVMRLIADCQSRLPPRSHASNHADRSRRVPSGRP